jgi:hypothetical protein
MPDLRWLLYRLRNLWRRQAREAELDAELQFHIEIEADEQIAAGLHADHARQAARRSLGNMTLAKEDARDVWTWGPIERFLQDVRYAVRVLGRQRSFTATALATIVVGIERFHCEPNGEAYNLYFVRPHIALDAEEAVMFNPRDEPASRLTRWTFFSTTASSWTCVAATGGALGLPTPIGFRSFSTEEVEARLPDASA